MASLPPTSSCTNACVPLPINSVPHDLITGISVIIELLLTATVLIFGREWKGTSRGASLDPKVCNLAYYSSLLLLVTAVWNAVIIMYRLAVAPDALGNKDELGITAAAFAALWYTDVMRMRPSVRRRRVIAEHLTSFPTFRFGPAGYNTPVRPQFQHAEFVVRSSVWELRGSSKLRKYWRGHVAFFAESRTQRESEGAAVVVLHDATTQDEAGADLLTPTFSHAPELSKQLVANVIWKAVVRSGLWNIHGWEPGFSSCIISVLSEIRAVQGIRTGELWNRVPDRAISIGGHKAGTEGRMTEEHARELCELLWAAITLEVMDYLSKGQRMTLLPTLVHIPVMIRSGKNAEWPAGSTFEIACEKFSELR